MASIQYKCIDSECGTITGLDCEGVIICENDLICPKCGGLMEPKVFNNVELLMGSNNPNGWKLEELLEQIKQEISHKINKIIDDASPQAQLVVKNNLSIIEHLGAAEALQRSSFVVLDAMKPNEGPTGKPRIGCNG